MTDSEVLAELSKRIGDAEGSIALERVFAPDWTPPDPICREVSNLCFPLNSNLFVPSAFPSITQCFLEALEFLASTFRQPTPCGQIVSGSTEGLFMAMEAAAHQIGPALNIVAPVTAHLSLHKAMRYRGIAPERVRWVDVDSVGIPDVGILAEQARQARPCFLFMTAGTVDFGSVDPIAAVAESLDDDGTWLHVDAASAGMVLPFLKQTRRQEFNFSIDKVRSLTVDVHKRGLAPLPCSFVLFREAYDLATLAQTGPYTGCLGTRPALTGSFPGVSAVWAWALFRKYGTEGFEQIALKGMRLAKDIAENLSAQGFTVLSSSATPLVVVPARDAEIIAGRCLENHGVWIEYSTRPCGLDNDLLRIGVMPHNSAEGASLLTKAIAASAEPGAGGLAVPR